MNKRIFSTLFTFFSLIFPLSAEASSFTGINVFGDSLVDTGNFFNLTNLPPSPPYAERFSNGEIWIDTLTDNLNLNPVLFSELGSAIPTEGINFAVGGASTGFNNVGGDPLPGLQQQIDSFINFTAIAPADSNALNIIWAGSNDYFLALSNPESLNLSLAEQATDNLASALQSLYDAGARNFLVVNLPNLGETPLVNELDNSFPGISSQLNDLVGVHNLLLEQKLNNLDASLPEIDLITLDTNSLLTEIVNEPSQFGYSNINDSCLLNSQIFSSFDFDGVCDNPNEFLFWDDIHPTSATHQLVAQVAKNTLQEQEHVPEPSNVLGLGLLASLILSWLNRSKGKPQK